MNMNATATMQQTQTQMHKMDGTGGGAGKGGANGMKDIMQSLSSEDRVVLQEQMSNLSSEDRVAAKEQLKSIDGTNLESSDYLQALLSALTPTEDTISDAEVFTPVYA